MSEKQTASIFGVYEESRVINEIFQVRQTRTPNDLGRDTNLTHNGECFDQKAIEIERKEDIKLLCDTISNVIERIYSRKPDMKSF